MYVKCDQKSFRIMISKLYRKINKRFTDTVVNPIKNERSRIIRFIYIFFFNKLFTNTDLVILLPMSFFFFFIGFMYTSV